jgi:HPt (histidine-containing phosphotransfer) domain-containing protein
VLYSSIVTPDNLKKGKAVGADHQISKPDLRLIVDIADRVLTDRIALNQLPSVVATTPTIADGNSVAVISTSSATIPDTVDKPTPASAVVAKSQPKSEQTVVVNNAGTREAGLPRSRPPRGINAQLWVTFYQELEGRTERLQRLTDAVQNSLPAVNEIQETARILHTIKSASAVVPLVAVRDITHEIESQLEPARSNPAAWPVQLLTKYCGWLRDILDETEGLDAVLEPSYARKAVLM